MIRLALSLLFLGVFTIGCDKDKRYEIDDSKEVDLVVVLKRDLPKAAVAEFFSTVLSNGVDDGNPPGVRAVVNMRVSGRVVVTVDYHASATRDQKETLEERLTESEFVDYFRHNMSAAAAAGRTSK